MATILEKCQDILDEKNTKILPQNIKSGTQIFDVTGTLTELKAEEKTITPTTSQQEILPSENKNAISKVTVNAVTSSIDNNIIAENIKKDVSILGVTGTLESGSSTTDATATAEDIISGKTAYISTGKVTGTYDASSLRQPSLTTSTSYSSYSKFDVYSPVPVENVTYTNFYEDCYMTTSNYGSKGLIGRCGDYWIVLSSSMQDNSYFDEGSGMYYEQVHYSWVVEKWNIDGKSIVDSYELAYYDGGYDFGYYPYSPKRVWVDEYNSRMFMTFEQTDNSMYHGLDLDVTNLRPLEDIVTDQAYSESLEELEYWLENTKRIQLSNLKGCYDTVFDYTNGKLYFVVPEQHTQSSTYTIYSLYYNLYEFNLSGYMLARNNISSYATLKLEGASKTANVSSKNGGTIQSFNTADFSRVRLSTLDINGTHYIAVFGNGSSRNYVYWVNPSNWESTSYLNRYFVVTPITIVDVYRNMIIVDTLRGTGITSARQLCIFYVTWHSSYKDVRRNCVFGYVVKGRDSVDYTHRGICYISYDKIAKPMGDTMSIANITKDYTAVANHMYLQKLSINDCPTLISEGNDGIDPKFIPIPIDDYIQFMIGTIVDKFGHIGFACGSESTSGTKTYHSIWNNLR